MEWVAAVKFSRAANYLKAKVIRIFIDFVFIFPVRSPVNAREKIGQDLHGLVSLLSNHLFDYVPVNVRQTVIPALEAIGQSFMINAQ